jgi:membrane protein implicated in regulation of membrane protease activity
MSSAPTPESMPEYKGAPLDADRGPGLGCFWIQVVALVIAAILAPLSAVLNWPAPIAIGLLFLVVILLLLVGQTSIFLLRLVAADRKGRRAPLRSATKTVGQLEDDAASDKGSGGVGESH